MLRRSLLAVLHTLALSLVYFGLPQTGWGAAEGSQEERLVVTLADNASNGAAALLESVGVRNLDQIRPLPVYRVATAPGQDSDAVLEALRANPLVRAAERDGEQTIRVVPDDPSYRPYQWNLRRIGMEHLWDLRPTAPEIVVAVLDTGVDLEHPDLRANLLVDQGYDFVHDTPVPQDDESHGTAVAGIIGAEGNNHEGMTGIAWRVKILPVKVLNSQGRGSNSTLARAIIYAVDQGARIINVSSTSSEYSTALELAVAYARERDVLVVAAAGNTGDLANEVTYPAALEGVLAVGAVDGQDHLAPFSQHGPYVPLVAPGVDVPSAAWPGAGQGQYASYSGTSIAAPHVSGVAALLWSLRPDLSAPEIAAELGASAENLDESNAAVDRASLVNAARALDAVRLGVTPKTGSGVEAQAPLPIREPGPLPLEPRRWYFAEGSTNPPFDVWFALQNPNTRPATVRFAFYAPEGTPTLHELQVGPSSRTTVYANDLLPNAEFSTIVESNIPIFVERSMYFGHDGHVAQGTREPDRAWYLAEGSTIPPFETWIELMNPNPSPTTARLRFMREDGSVTDHVEGIPPWGRRSVYVNLLFTAAGFGTHVEANQPIVVERAMYFDAGRGGHDTVGTQTPGRVWYLAEGVSRPGFDTWLLVQNAGVAPANVKASFLTDDGTVVAQPLRVPPNSRISLYTNLVVPNAAFGIKVEADQPVVVERAVYFDEKRAGFSARAVAAPGTEWYLPEGVTTGSFTEQLAILNPQGQLANVQVDFDRLGGQTIPPHRLRVGPNTQRILDINPYVVDGELSLRVIADQPIVVERILYFARPSGVGATSSTGLTR